MLAADQGILSTCAFLYRLFLHSLLLCTAIYLLVDEEQGQMYVQKILQCME